MTDCYEATCRNSRHFWFTVADVLACLEDLPDEYPVRFCASVDLSGYGYCISDPCDVEVLDIVDYGDAVIAQVDIDYDRFSMERKENREAVWQAALFHEAEHERR